MSMFMVTKEPDACSTMCLIVFNNSGWSITQRNPATLFIVGFGPLIAFVDDKKNVEYCQTTPFSKVAFKTLSLSLKLELLEKTCNILYGSGLIW